MKYSTHNFQDCPFPLRFPVRLHVEYRPGGVLSDYAHFDAKDESAVDEIICLMGWPLRDGFSYQDVWVDWSFYELA